MITSSLRIIWSAIGTRTNEKVSTPIGGRGVFHLPNDAAFLMAGTERWRRRRTKDLAPCSRVLSRFDRLARFNNGHVDILVRKRVKRTMRRRGTVTLDAEAVDDDGRGCSFGGALRLKCARRVDWSDFIFFNGGFSGGFDDDLTVTFSMITSSDRSLYESPTVRESDMVSRENYLRICVRLVRCWFEFFFVTSSLGFHDELTQFHLNSFEFRPEPCTDRSRLHLWTILMDKTELSDHWAVITGFHFRSMVARDQMCFRTLPVTQNVIDSNPVVIHTRTGQCLPTRVGFALIGMKVTKSIDKSVVGNQVGKPQTRRTGVEMLDIRRKERKAFCSIFWAGKQLCLHSNRHRDHSYR